MCVCLLTEQLLFVSRAAAVSDAQLEERLCVPLLSPSAVESRDVREGWMSKGDDSPSNLLLLQLISLGSVSQPQIRI